MTNFGSLRSENSNNKLRKPSERHQEISHFQRFFQITFLIHVNGLKQLSTSKNNAMILVPELCTQQTKEPCQTQVWPPSLSLSLSLSLSVCVCVCVLRVCFSSSKLVFSGQIKEMQQNIILWFAFSKNWVAWKPNPENLLNFVLWFRSLNSQKQINAKDRQRSREYLDAFY